MPVAGRQGFTDGFAGARITSPADIQVATQKSAETYDVFISFAYGDREWAERLADELSERGLTSFVGNKESPFDRVKEERLTTVLDEARACVVLWSSGSYKDDWVGLELSRSVGRSPVVLVLLEEGPATPDSDYPAIGAIRDEGSYADGPDAVSPATWREVVRAIDRAVRRVPDAVPAFKLSDSVAGLRERLRGAVSAQQAVADLISRHADYADNAAQSFQLGREPASGRKQTIDEWLIDLAAVLDSARVGALHGRLFILGAGLAEQALGRRLTSSGLFGAIEAELREPLETLLTEEGVEAREDLEPERLAGYVADTIHDVDRLGIMPDVRSLCAVVAAEDVAPPLSIGLFGEWGTGKSFFIRQMQLEIERLADGSQRARKHGTDSPFCENVVQIDFNAWHYIDANLWASLMARLWERLAAFGEGTVDEPDERHRELLQRLETSGELLRGARRDADDADARLTEARNELQELERERSEESRELGALSTIDVAAEVAAQQEVRDAVAKLERQAGLRKDALGLADVQALAKNARGLTGRWRAFWTLLGARGPVRQALVLLAVALLAIGVAWLTARQWVEGAVAATVSVLSILGVAARTLLGIIGPGASALTAATEVVRQADDASLKRREELAQRAAELRAGLASVEQEAAARRDDLREAEDRKRSAERAIEEIEAGRGVRRYIEERAASGDYERQLGLISLIQRDLERLSSLMRPGGRKPAAVRQEDDQGPALPEIDRVVLYIDDLDRCPSRLVVEVLQAVHLLLAYPLFVVVVGVDPRWLLSSLRRHHTALLGSETTGDGTDIAEWASTPQSYLEKIFQVPYTLQPMRRDGYARLVGSLLPVATDSTPPGADAPGLMSEPTAGTHSDAASQERPTTKAPREDDDDGPRHANLVIEPQELEYVERLWAFMPTPRAVKRLVNVYRFLRAGVRARDLPRFTGDAARIHDGEAKGDYQPLLLLLAILVGHPEHSSAAFDAVMRSNRKEWGGLLEDLERELSDAPRLLSCLRQASEGLERTPLEPFRAWAPRVARFSFSIWEPPEAPQPSSQGVSRG